MTKFLTVVGGGVLVLGLLFLLPLLSALGGAFAGWVVGWFFAETITSFLAAFGVKGLAMWQIGMALGFVGGFFKTTTVSKS